MVETQARLFIYVTGFGPFGSVRENPTMKLIDWLRTRAEALQADGIKIMGTHIVEVSASAARDSSSEIEAVMSECTGPKCVLHLGVCVGAKKLLLECRAFNTANFSIPDVRGWVAQGEAIVDGAPKCGHTKLPVTQLLCDLHDAGVAAEVSSNPGTYICNYIYYSSLDAASRSKNAASVMFVHTPSFSDMPEADQCKGLEELLRSMLRLAEAGRL